MNVKGFKERDRKENKRMSKSNSIPFVSLWVLVFFHVGWMPGPYSRASAAKNKPKQPSKKLRLNALQRYEESLIKWALKQSKLTRDPKPGGKIIERIVIIRANVIAPIDPWPKIINWVHIKTRDRIIRQELLVKPGEVWKKQLVAESERNLRRLSILTTARTIACRSKKPNHVILLVITKDIWSLRLSTGFNYAGTVLQQLTFYPMELNLLGLRKQLGLIIALRQLDLTTIQVRNQIVLGQFFYDPRLFGTRLELYEEFAVYLDGDVPCAGSNGGDGYAWCPENGPGTPNGIYARLNLSRSLFSLSTRWAYAFNATYSSRQIRSFRQNDPNQPIPPGERAGLSLQTAQFERSNRLFAIPRAYTSRYFIASASLTHSIGYLTKHNIGATAGVSWYNYTVPSNFPFSDELRQQFLQLSAPRSESYAYVTLGYSFRSVKFYRLRNVNLFALSEDFTVGPSFSVSVRPSIDLTYPDQQYIVLSASAGYSWEFAGNFLYLSTTAGTRWQPRSNEIGIPGPWLNNYFTASAYHISPLLLFGRFFARAYVSLNSNNIDNAVSGLGANSGLRGYTDGLFQGLNKFQANAEFRTLPLNFWTLHLGLVAFYDAGALWGGRDPNRPTQQLDFLFRHSVGIGVRALFPQFSKSIVRIDMGVPLATDRGPPLSWFSVTFGQVF